MVQHDCPIFGWCIASAELGMCRLARADQDRSRPCTGKARIVVALQLTALAVLVWFWYRIVKRVCWQGFGMEAVLLSPGIMWLLPLHMGCLLLAKRRRHCHCKSI